MDRRIIGLPFLVLLALLASFLSADDAPKTADAGSIVVVDAAGKEQKVKSWSITAGVRQLNWLVPDEKEDPKAKKSASGPTALLVRDERKIHFLAGVVTFVPVDRLRSISFDKDKETMTVRAAVSAKASEDVVLTGTTAYRGINKITIEAEVDKGDAGVAAITFQGGIPKGIKEVRFPEPKVDASKPGRPAVVVTLDKEVKTTHKVSDLQPLYLLRSNREKLSTTLFFRKTLKIDVNKVKKITVGAEDSDDVVWQVVQKDDDSTLTLLQSTMIDGQTATLVGLLGKVPVGYKLFPVRRIQSIHFDTSDEPKEKEKEKDGR